MEPQHHTSGAAELKEPTGPPVELQNHTNGAAKLREPVAAPVEQQSFREPQNLHRWSRKNFGSCKMWGA